MKQAKEFTMSRKDYIDFLANKSNEISMSNKNSKTGIACLNIAMPVAVCREDAPVKADAMRARDVKLWQQCRQHITET